MASNPRDAEDGMALFSALDELGRYREAVALITDLEPYETLAALEADLRLLGTLRAGAMWDLDWQVVLASARRHIENQTLEGYASLPLLSQWDEPPLHRLAARQVKQRYAAPLRRTLPGLFAAQPDRRATARTRIRIGYLGGTLSHHATASLLASRPAALQIYHLDVPGPPTASGIDYIVLDRYTAPLGSDDFDEAVLALPHSYHPASSLRTLPNPAPRKGLGWPEDAVVFADFGMPIKLSPEIFLSRVRIVQTVCGSVYVQACSSADTAESVRRFWLQAGMASERLILVDHIGLLAHYARLQAVDICLPTFPYGPATNVIEALRCDVPTLALVGRSVASRNAGSILHTHGFGELVSHNLEELEAKAIYYGTKTSELACLKARLKDARSTSLLFDATMHARMYERGLEMAWERHAGGMPPARIDVPDSTSAGSSRGASSGAE